MKNHSFSITVTVLLLTVSAFFNGCETQITGNISDNPYMSYHEIRMADNAWMMIHDPWIVTGGTADELRQTADTMDGVRQTLLDTYVSRSGADSESISNMMKAETWLNASEASELGLADNVGEALAIAAHVHKGWFKHIPDQLQDVVEVEKAPNLDYVKGILAKQNHVLRQMKL